MLDQLTKGTDHTHSINRLNTRAFQLIVEIGIFVGGEIELRGVLHDQQAAVHHEAAGEKFVEIVNCSCQENRKSRDNEIGHNQQPKVFRKRLSVRDVTDDAVDDETRYQQCPERQQGGNQTEE